MSIGELADQSFVMTYETLTPQPLPLIAHPFTWEMGMNTYGVAGITGYTFEYVRWEHRSLLIIRPDVVNKYSFELMADDFSPWDYRIRVDCIVIDFSVTVFNRRLGQNNTYTHEYQYDGMCFMSYPIHRVLIHWESHTIYVIDVEGDLFILRINNTREIWKVMRVVGDYRSIYGIDNKIYAIADNGCGVFLIDVLEYEISRIGRICYGGVCVCIDSLFAWLGHGQEWYRIDGSRNMWPTVRVLGTDVTFCFK
jgi:hypothetical protein